MLPMVALAGVVVVTSLVFARRRRRSWRREGGFWCALRRVSPAPGACDGGWVTGEARWIGGVLELRHGRLARVLDEFAVSILLPDLVWPQSVWVKGHWRHLAVAEALLTSGSVVHVATRPGALVQLLEPWTATACPDSEADFR